MKQLLSYLKKYTVESILAPLFKLLEATFELFIPLVIKSIIDEGVKGGNTSLIWREGGTLILLALVGLTAAVTAQYFAAKAATGVGTDIRKDLFCRVQKMNYADIDKIGTSTLLSRLSGDTNQVQSGVNMALRLYLRSPFIVFGAALMAFSEDVESGFIFAVLVPLLFLAVFTVLLVTLPLYQKVQAAGDRLLSKTRENLRGTRVIRAFCQEDSEISKFNTSNDALLVLQKYAGKISALLNPGTQLLVNAAIIVLLYTGAVRVNVGVLTTGTVVALYNYMSQILVELIKLSNLVITSTRAVASGKRIFAVLNAPNALSPVLSVPDGITEDAHIEFKNVCFRYPDSAGDTLSDISFTVKRGGTVGIIGGTGSGKSSLIRLIPHFYDATRGVVLINGENVQTMPREKLLKSVGFVPQKAQLFSGTIRSNILFGNPDAGEDEIKEALRLASADDIVASKPEGLDAPVTENGSNLSGGQKQRLTIARALVKRPEILIFDDSFSALDYATDARLRHNLSSLSYHPTVIIVSQRISSLMNADTILVLEDGKLAASGTHNELLKSSPVYLEIAETQIGAEANA